MRKSLARLPSKRKMTLISSRVKNSPNSTMIWRSPTKAWRTSSTRKSTSFSQFNALKSFRKAVKMNKWITSKIQMKRKFKVMDLNPSTKCRACKNSLTRIFSWQTCFANRPTSSRHPKPC